MTIIIILVCIASICGVFYTGYLVGKKSISEEGIVVTKDNKEFIQEMLAWRNFGGR